MPMTLDGTSGMTAPAGAVYNGLIQMTAQNTSSGTSFDFTGIPLWVRRVTISFSNVGTTGNNLLIQLGSGTVTTSGYTCISMRLNTSSSGNAAASTSSSGLIISANGNFHGSMVLTNISGNLWTSSHVGRVDGSTISSGGGSVTLAGTLDRLRLTSNSGTDTFNAGSANVIYE